MASALDTYAPQKSTRLQWNSPTTTPYKNDVWKTRKQPDFFGRTPEAEEVFPQMNVPKLPGFDPILKKSALEVEDTAGRLGGDIQRYRDALAAATPAVTAFTNQDVGEVSNVLSPAGYEAQLAGIRARREKAMGGLQGVLFGDLRRSLGLEAIGSGGVSGAGLSSYLMSKAGDTAARLRTQAIADAADQERTDTAALMAARAGQLGRRQALTDTLTGRAVLPTSAESLLQQQTLSNRLAALQAALANSQIDYATQAG